LELLPFFRQIFKILILFIFYLKNYKSFLTLANQKQELPLVAIFVGGMGRNEETL
jgi:hypothetical protein